MVEPVLDGTQVGAVVDTFLIAASIAVIAEVAPVAATKVGVAAATCWAVAAAPPMAAPAAPVKPVTASPI